MKAILTYLFVGYIYSFAFTQTHTFVGGGGDNLYSNVDNWAFQKYPGTIIDGGLVVDIDSDCKVDKQVTVCGRLNISASFDVSIAFYNRGVTTVKENGILTSASDKFVVNYGDLIIEIDGECDLTGIFLNYGNFTNEGYFISNKFIVNFEKIDILPGSSFFFSTELENYGFLTISNSLTIPASAKIINYDDFNISSNLTNSGIIDNYSDLIIEATGSLINKGTINNSALLRNEGTYNNEVNSIFNNLELSRFDNRTGAIFTVNPTSDFIQGLYSHLIIR